MIDLWLFAHDADRVGLARAAGISTFLVDWEHRNKDSRQAGVDTEINHDTDDDLRRLAELGVDHRICRIDRLGPWSELEIETAIEADATALLLPMVERPEDLRFVRDRTPDGMRIGILIETEVGVGRAKEILAAGPDFVYLGLHDLSISRSRPLFEPVIDGTVERLRAQVGDRPFGFGGLTVVDGGAPIPCALLLAEMARLDCDFSFARRSFRRDIRGRDWPCELERLSHRWDELQRRSRDQVDADRHELVRCIEGIGVPA